MEIKKNTKVFDIQVSTFSRAVQRVIIISTTSLIQIFIGYFLIPKNVSFWFKMEDLQHLSFLGFIGACLFLNGAIQLIKLLSFIIRELGHSGDWHFKLSNGYLVWDVTDHAHGTEVGFRTTLTEIRELELKTIEQYENFDKREYWIHFRNSPSLQLRDYSGISLSWLVEKINQQGVKYVERTYT